MRSSSVLLTTAPLLAAAADSSPWDLITAGVESWAAISFDAKFAINVGDATGTLYQVRPVPRRVCGVRFPPLVPRSPCPRAPPVGHP
jgi:hypothetical protein